MKDNRQNREAKEYLEKTEVDKVFQLRLQDKNLWTDVEVQTAEWLKADIDKLPVTEAPSTHRAISSRPVPYSIVCLPARLRGLWSSLRA